MEEEIKKEYYVVPTFDSAMEEVQFMSIYKSNMFKAKDNESAHSKMYKLMNNAKKRGIKCNLHVVAKTIES